MAGDHKQPPLSPAGCWGISSSGREGSYERGAPQGVFSHIAP